MNGMFYRELKMEVILPFMTERFKTTVNVEIFTWGNFHIFRAFVFFAKISPTRK